MENKWSTLLKDLPKFLKGWSGRRESNPRHPARENGRRLIIKNLGVYIAKSRLYRITIFFQADSPGDFLVDDDLFGAGAYHNSII
jgi:hypothetical protein